MNPDSVNPQLQFDVLSLCDRTGNMVRPWAEAGHTCLCVDIQHSKQGTSEEVGKGFIYYLGCDLRWFIPPQSPFRFGFGQPPCTNLSVSGARWFKSKGLTGLIEGLELVERCRLILQTLSCPWAIENPISTLATYWRQPDYKFDPCDYAGYEGGSGDTYTKKTCLWASSTFNMPKAKRVEPTDTRIHYMAPSENRGDLRSETPKGFARAVFEANNN